MGRVGLHSDSFTTFGELLKHLRRRARLTQRELGIAVGYSEAQITRLEGDSRKPDPAMVRAQFTDALNLRNEPEWAQRLIEMAEVARNKLDDEMAMSSANLTTTRRTNLPASLTRLIGREDDLQEVTRLMGVNRLLTLTGAGGVGKTRLALEAGGVMLDQFTDGVWLVELAPIMDAALVPQTVAAVFGLPSASNHMPVATLTTFLAGKQALLILDNCEHLIQVCAEFADMFLRACPHLRIMATSRELLRVSGEAAWPVPSLTIPDPLHLPVFEQIRDYTAVQLFIEHAKLSQPGLSLTHDILATAAHICCLLDGIPLAIEMAAALIAVLPITDIVARLDNRFTLLNRGSRVALSHHRTLRETLDWSYDLLSEQEQVILARLSVFVGGWTADAVKVVCSDEGSLEFDIQLILLQLVSKSLVVMTPGEGMKHGMAPRYHLLETIRQYARIKLTERGEVELARTYKQHLAYFLAMAEETMDLGGRHVYAWVKRLDPDYNNIRAAFDWARICAETDGGEMMLRLAAALRPYWWHFRGSMQEAYEWLSEAVAHGSQAPAPARARALMVYASILVVRAETEKGIQVAEESLAIFRETDDRVGMAWCIQFLVNQVEDTAYTQLLAEEALGLFRLVGSLAGVSRALWDLGDLAIRAGDYARAMPLLEESIQIAQDTLDIRSAQNALRILHLINPIRARILCEEIVSHLREEGSEEQQAVLLTLLGDFFNANTQYAQARQVLIEALTLWQQASRYAQTTWSAGTLAELAFAERMLGHLDQAIVYLDQALALTRQTVWIYRIHSVQFQLATLLIAQGNLTEGTPHLLQCLRGFHQMGSLLELESVLVQMAGLAHHSGDARRVIRLLAAATVIRSEKHSMDQWRRNAVSSIVVPAIDAARAELGNNDFESAWTEGRAMMLDQAVKYALAGYSSSGLLLEKPWNHRSVA